MAATVPRALLLAIVSAAFASADQSQDVLRVITQMTTALGDNDPAQAMAAFDRSFRNFDQLSGYFSNLTDSFLITNEAGVTEEQDTPTETKLELDWTLTLRNQSTDQSIRRHQNVGVRLVLKQGQWRIVDFSPIQLFNPQM